MMRWNTFFRCGLCTALLMTGLFARGADVLYADRETHDLRIGYSANNDTPVPVRTTCRIVPTETCLEFHLRAEDSDIAAVRACPADGCVWSCCENFEFFFDPSGAGKGYTQFAVSANGAMYDSRQKKTTVGHKPVTRGDATKADDGFGWQREIRLFDDAWELDVTIPWTALGVTHPETGDFWRFNITRSFKSVGSAPSDGTWAHVGPMFKNVSGFGTLYFGSREEVVRAQAARNRALAEELTARAASLGVAADFTEKLKAAREDETGRRLKSVSDELRVVEILNR